MTAARYSPRGLDAAGKATLFTAGLPVGTHSITAGFGGAASAPLAQVVNPAVTTTALTSSAGVVSNPVPRPDHIVVVIEEDRSARAVGDAALPYINSLAAGGLVYAGLSLTSYADGLPSADDVTTIFAADPGNALATDAYARSYNPAAMFTDVCAGKDGYH